MYTFSKEERLCSKKLLEELFLNGSSFLLYPFKLTWLFNPSGTTPKVKLVTVVSKKRFKRAVDRNRIKRLIKEAYRLNKTEELISFLPEKQILLSVNYIGKDIPDFLLIQKKLVKSFGKLVSLINDRNEID